MQNKSFNQTQNEERYISLLNEFLEYNLADNEQSCISLAKYCARLMLYFEDYYDSEYLGNVPEADYEEEYIVDAAETPNFIEEQGFDDNMNVFLQALFDAHQEFYESERRLGNVPKEFIYDDEA